MKKFFLLIPIFIVFSIKTMAQPSVVISALSTNNIDQLSDQFDKIMDLKFPEKEEIKSIGKTQATISIKSFFTESKVKSFQLTSQNEMAGVSYIAGKLQNETETFKITIMMKTKDGKSQIVSIRISK